MDLSPIITDAFVRHLEHHLFDRWTAEQDAAEAAAWEPIRQRLRAVASMPTVTEQNELRRFPPPWKLRPTPGWPPIAIPGQPGRYFTLNEDRQDAA